MGSSRHISPEFAAVFRANADSDGIMTFARFMELALYHPEVGYYRRRKPRIGYALGTDFFTASTSGPIFGELVAAACVKLLGGRDPRAHAFVEIGAEMSGGVLAGVTHLFRETRALRIGEPLRISGDCVVFSNELFDAQPCVRTVFRGGAWHEIGVRLAADELVEAELPSSYHEPASAEGYHLDRPLASAELAKQIAAQPWHGLFVAIDYGKTWRELAQETPAGTARAYHRHMQSNDLLAQPGEQDLTCHVCWDWLMDALRQHGFAEPTLEFQESFFIRHAGEFIERTTTAEAARFSQRKLALLQLLHPAHLGQKFQVLHALR
jgi:SAM-dependent MidA family methyltransferase